MVATTDEFKMAMRRLAAGISIITTEYQGVDHGFAATAVSSLSGTPPSLLVCINKSTSSHEPVIKSGIFCVNLLSDKHRGLAERFSRSDLRESRFGDDVWQKLSTGAPALAGSLASIDCRVVEVHEAFTHTIVIGRMEEVKFWQDEVNPLVYLGGHFGLWQPQPAEYA